jgi:high-affinity iron transporter
MALAEFIVSFREFFEIALIISVIVAYLHKSGQGRMDRFVWMGAGAAGLASLALAWAFEALAGGFERWEALFEGVALLFAAGMVSWLILWMMRQANVARTLQMQTQQRMKQGSGPGLALLAFGTVFREGVEIVLFFAGIQITSGRLNLVGAGIGAALALLLAWGLYIHLVRLDLGRFFKLTGAILVLMAGGLVGQGVHELEEAGMVPPLIEHVYDLNPPLAADGGYPLLHEKGAAGAMLKGLAGYDANPSLMQMAAQLGYYGAVLVVYRKISTASARHSAA